MIDIALRNITLAGGIGAILGGFFALLAPDNLTIVSLATIGWLGFLFILWKNVR